MTEKLPHQPTSSLPRPLIKNMPGQGPVLDPFLTQPVAPAQPMGMGKKSKIEIVDGVIVGRGSINTDTQVDERPGLFIDRRGVLQAGEPTPVAVKAVGETALNPGVITHGA